MSPIVEVEQIIMLLLFFLCFYPLIFWDLPSVCLLFFSAVKLQPSCLFLGANLALRYSMQSLVLLVAPRSYSFIRKIFFCYFYLWSSFGCQPCHNELAWCTISCQVPKFILTRCIWFMRCFCSSERRLWANIRWVFNSIIWGWVGGFDPSNLSKVGFSRVVENNIVWWTITIV